MEKAQKTKNILYDLYKQQPNEQVTPFTDENGLSIIRNYKNPKFPEYRLMMRFLLNENGQILGEANTVWVQNPSDPTHTVVDNPDLKLNNFYFSGNDVVLKGEFVQIKSEVGTTFNKLVDRTEKTHLSKFINLRLYFFRLLYKILIFTLAWLGDTKYSYPKDDRDDDMSLYSYRERGIEKQELERPAKPDPLFKYFHINKNIFTVAAAVAAIFLFFKQSYYAQDITKISSVIFGLSILIFLEEASLRLNKILSNESPNSFIQRLLRKSRSENQHFSLAK